MIPFITLVIEYFFSDEVLLPCLDWELYIAYKKCSQTENNTAKKN